MINMGFVRVAALSPNVTVADPAANVAVTSEDGTLVESELIFWKIL